MSIILILLLIVVGMFFMMGRYSANQQAPVLSNDEKFSCGATPNCVTSQQVRRSSQKIDPLNLEGFDDAHKSLLDAVLATGGEVVDDGNGSIVAVYTSSFFGFVDDVMIRVDAPGQRAEIISRSRVGYSDLGLNRKRVEAIRAALNGS